MHVKRLVPLEPERQDIGRGQPDRLASRSRRIVAAVLDRIVFPTVALYGSLLVGVLVGANPFKDDKWGWWAVPSCVFVVANEFIGTAIRGQTFGKFLLRMRVIRADTLGPPGFARTVIRTFGLAPLGWVPYAGLAAEVADNATFFLSRRRQALHDMLSGTIVVDDEPWRRWTEWQDRRERLRQRH